MPRRFAGCLGMFLALCTPILAAEEPSKSATDPTPTPSPATEKMIHLSTKYKEVGEVVSEVFKVDSNSLTIRVTWYTVTPGKTGRTPNMANLNRGSNPRNPQQMQQHMMMMQQAMQRQAIQAAKNAKPQEHHQDYSFPFAEDAHARAKHLPPKLDDNGKKVPYTPEELRELKANIALSGYERPLDSIKVGSIVELHLGHMVGAPKDKKDDLYIRWVYILDESTVKNTGTKQPDSSSSSPSANPSKKN